MQLQRYEKKPKKTLFFWSIVRFITDCFHSSCPNYPVSIYPRTQPSSMPYPLKTAHIPILLKKHMLAYF